MSAPQLSFHSVQKIRVIRTRINGTNGPFGTITIQATDKDGQKAEFLMYVDSEKMEILESSDE